MRALSPDTVNMRCWRALRRLRHASVKELAATIARTTENHEHLKRNIRRYVEVLVHCGYATRASSGTIHLLRDCSPAVPLPHQGGVLEVAVRAPQPNEPDWLGLLARAVRRYGNRPVARALGVGESTVRDWGRGRRRPRPEVRARIENTLTVGGEIRPQSDLNRSTRPRTSPEQMRAKARRGLGRLTRNRSTA